MKNVSYLIFLLGLWSCNESTCIKSLGDPVKETRVLDPFDAIDISDKINLILHQDSTYKVRVETGENLVDFIQTEVQDNRLYIYDDNTCDFLRTYDHVINVHVYLPELKEIECSNTGNIIALDTIKTRRFKFDQWAASGENEIWLVCDSVYLKQHTGTGDLKVIGSSRYTYIYNAGYGYMHADQFESINGSVRIENSGDVELYVTNRVNAEMNGPGNLTLYGTPKTVNQSGEGSGTIDYQ